MLVQLSEQFLKSDQYGPQHCLPQSIGFCLSIKLLPSGSLHVLSVTTSLGSLDLSLLSLFGNSLSLLSQPRMLFLLQPKDSGDTFRRETSNNDGEGE